MKFTDLAKVAQHNDSKPFKEGLKSFSVRFEASANGKASNMISEFTKHVSRAFTAVHDKGCYACNSKIEIVLRTPDKLFDFSHFGATQRALHTALESIGMKHPGITVRHVKAKTASFIEVEGTFKDVSPLDLYRTETQHRDE